MQTDKRPLAERLRPVKPEHLFGQEHITSKESGLRKAIESGKIPSMILWGPPGVGKTSLAKMICGSDRNFYTLSAVSSGVKDVRDTIKKAESSPLFNQKSPVLFIDEIHRFSKSQQDSLLAAVENGTLVLIGATTENPSFEVINPLLSRAQVYTLKPLDEKAIDKLLERALNEDKLLQERDVKFVEKNALYRYSGGDARKLLNIIEVIVHATNETPLEITDKLVEKELQENISSYDKSGEQHYDIISAFIKSVRGSDTDASVYWLARMIHGGEKPEFIARRLIILAAEDIGLANPEALSIANATFDAVHNIGMPEARIVLAECTIYLAASAKSNSAYIAVDKALEHINKYGEQPVPLHIRNAPTKLMKNLNYGKNYKYPHDYSGNFVKQQYLPDNLKNLKLYSPAENRIENKIKEKINKQNNI